MKRLMSAVLVAALGVTCLGGCQAGSSGGDTAVNGKGRPDLCLAVTGGYIP